VDRRSRNRIAVITVKNVIVSTADKLYPIRCNPECNALRARPRADFIYSSHRRDRGWHRRGAAVHQRAGSPDSLQELEVRAGIGQFIVEGELQRYRSQGEERRGGGSQRDARKVQFQGECLHEILAFTSCRFPEYSFRYGCRVTNGTISSQETGVPDYPE